MVKRFSKKYRNKGRAFNYLLYEIYVSVRDLCYIPTSLSPEQTAKTNIIASMVRIQVFSIMHS